MRVDVCHRVRQAIDTHCSHVWVREGEGGGRGRINFLQRLSSHTEHKRVVHISLCPKGMQRKERKSLQGKKDIGRDEGKNMARKEK